MNNKNVIIVDDIHVLSFVKTIDNKHTFVELSFQIPGQDTSPSVLVPMSEINTSEITEHLPDGYVMKFQSKRTQAAYMRSVIAEAQKDKNTPYYKLLRPGYNTLENGRLAYVFGDVVVGKLQNHYYPYNPEGLTVNKRLLKIHSHDLFDWTYRWAESPCLAALLLVALSSVTFPIVTELSPQSEALIGFIQGKTGSGKTAYATLITDLFQGKGFSFSLIAPKKVFYDMVKCRSNIPILIDDLSASASVSDNQKKIGKLTELILTKSSSGSYMDGVSSHDMRELSLIVTAENTLSGAPSSMNRSVVIKFPESLDTETLTFMQEHNWFPALVYKISFWICLNREEITKRVVSSILNTKEILPPFQNIPCAGAARINMSYKTLLITKMVLQDFFQHCGMFDSKKLAKLEKKTV